MEQPSFLSKLYEIKAFREVDSPPSIKALAQTRVQPTLNLK